MYNRSSTCTYCKSEHASNCLEVYFPSFFCCCFSESHYLATKPFSLILSERETDRQTDRLTYRLILSPCSMSCCRVYSLQILWDSENWLPCCLLNLARCVLDEMIFTCWSSKLVEGNEPKVTNSASRISACGCASLIYSSAASSALAMGRVTFCTTYVFVFILLCVWEGTVTGSI